MRCTPWPCDASQFRSCGAERPSSVTRPTQDGTRLHVGVAELGRSAAQLLTWLAAQGHAVHRISSGRADLEDVFLSLTGSQLRD